MTSNTRRAPTPTKKKCALCAKVKPLDDFPKYSRHPDGHSDWCRACWAAKRAEKAAIAKKPQTAKKAAPAKVAAPSVKRAKKAVETPQTAPATSCPYDDKCAWCGEPAEDAIGLGWAVCAACGELYGSQMPPAISDARLKAMTTPRHD